MSFTFQRRVAAALLAPVLFLAAACGDDDDDAADTTEPAEEAASVSFVAPEDGAHVAGGVHLEMAATGLTIEPAGEVHEGAGHFHVIADDDCVEPGAAVAKDADHVHFGKAQTEGTIYLEPGSHELCLQPGDGAHVALDPTDTVTVEVGIESRDEWCGVVKEIDDLFLAADTSEEEFAVRKGSYVNIGRLFAQVLDGIDQVDAEQRADVTTTIETGSAIAAAFAGAADQAAAEAALMEVFGVEGVQSDTPGATWILDTCGVDIDG